MPCHRAPRHPSALSPNSPWDASTDPADLLALQVHFLLIMSEGAVTVRTKKFITNRLLQRKQFVRRCRSMLDHTRRPHATGGEESRTPAQLGARC